MVFCLRQTLVFLAVVSAAAKDGTQEKTTYLRSLPTNVDDEQNYDAAVSAQNISLVFVCDFVIVGHL